MIVLVSLIVLLRELLVSTIFRKVHPYIAIHYTCFTPSARMRSEGYGSWVCLCVCVSTQRQHLTSRMFIRPTNDTTYLTGNEDQKICGVFSESAPLQS